MPLLGSARSIRAIVKRRCLKRDVLPNISSTMVPTAVLLSCFFIISLWRKAHVRWSILANHLIYGMNAWANVWTHICGSFGEKLSVYSFTSTYYCDRVHIRNRWKLAHSRANVSWGWFHDDVWVCWLHYWYYDIRSSFEPIPRQQRSYHGRSAPYLVWAAHPCTNFHYERSYIDQSLGVSVLVPTTRWALSPFPWVITVSGSYLPPSLSCKLQKSLIDTSKAGL